MLKRITKTATFGKLKTLYERYERFLIPGMLIAGVFVDYVTFTSIQIDTTFILLGIYALVAGAVIAFTNIYDNKRRENRYGILRYVRLALPLVLQFAFGALLSASLIFYWFSGALSVSWPIMIIVAVLMTSNEVLQKYYRKPLVQFAVFFFVLFSLGTLAFPFLFSSIESIFFVLGGVSAVLVLVLFVYFVSLYAEKIKELQKQMAVVFLGIFAFMNVLYFSNLIPPIPLSIREAGVYYDVQRSNGTYILNGEKESFLDQIIPGKTIHVKKNHPLYVFSSIFAPSNLDTTIVHKWQYFDETKSEWLDKDMLSYRMFGSTDSGYRGYTFKTNVLAGKWRVDIETERGQVLGRLKFVVENVDKTPETEIIVR